MRKAVDDLGNLRRDLDPFDILSEAKDEISQQFVGNCAAAVRDARDFFISWREQLAAAIDAMEQQIKSYESIEERNRRRYA